MRNISFAFTTKQFLDGTKTVTRRMGWLKLKRGDHLMAVEKGQGLKKGERAKRLGEIEILAVNRERLSAVTDREVQREGFPGRKRLWFIIFFCKTHKRCQAHSTITRIWFRRVG